MEMSAAEDGREAGVSLLMSEIPTGRELQTPVEPWCHNLCNDGVGARQGCGGDQMG